MATASRLEIEIAADVSKLAVGVKQVQSHIAGLTGTVDKASTAFTGLSGAGFRLNNILGPMRAVRRAAMDVTRAVDFVGQSIKSLASESSNARLDTAFTALKSTVKSALGPAATSLVDAYTESVVVLAQAIDNAGPALGRLAQTVADTAAVFLGFGSGPRDLANSIINFAQISETAFLGFKLAVQIGLVDLQNRLNHLAGPIGIIVKGFRALQAIKSGNLKEIGEAIAKPAIDIGSSASGIADTAKALAGVAGAYDKIRKNAEGAAIKGLGQLIPSIKLSEQELAFFRSTALAVSNAFAGRFVPGQEAAVAAITSTTEAMRILNEEMDLANADISEFSFKAPFAFDAVGASVSAAAASMTGAFVPGIGAAVAASETLGKSFEQIMAKVKADTAQARDLWIGFAESAAFSIGRAISAGKDFGKLIQQLISELLRMLAIRALATGNVFGAVGLMFGSGLVGGAEFHDGGKVGGSSGRGAMGLRNDERMAVLQTGEIVLSRKTIREMTRFHDGGSVKATVAANNTDSINPEAGYGFNSAVGRLGGLSGFGTSTSSGGGRGGSTGGGGGAPTSGAPIDDPSTVPGGPLGQPPGPPTPGHGGDSALPPDAQLPSLVGNIDKLLRGGSGGGTKLPFDDEDGFGRGGSGGLSVFINTAVPSTRADLDKYVDSVLKPALRRRGMR